MTNNKELQNLVEQWRSNAALLNWEDGALVEQCADDLEQLIETPHDHHDREEPIDITCPSSTCGSSDVVLTFADVYAVGGTDPEKQVRGGAKCLECGLQFWNEDAAEAYEQIK